MNKIIIIIVILKILCTGSSSAQNFFPLPPGFNGNVRSLFYDSTSNILYSGGNFTASALGTPMNHIARWDGSIWDSLGAGIGGNVFAFAKYQNMILAGGAYNMAGGMVSKGIAAWDGSTWQHFADATSVSGNGCVFSLLVDGNNLYISGCFDSINGISAQGVAHYDGFQWHSYPMLDPVNIAFVSDIEIFNGELYVAGDFNAGPGLKDIVKFDGANWVTVGGGLSGGSTFVDNMMVYQGELYIVGEFNISTGDPGNSIAKWNGAAWSSLGSGLNAGGQLFCISAFKNEIYVGGLFSSIGGISTSFIARWDGSNWGSIGTFDNGVDFFASTANDLYMGGGFKTINGDTMNYITRYGPPLGMDENALNTSGIAFSPNPNKGNFSLTSLFYLIESIRFFDLSGRIIFSKNKILSNTFECKLNSPDGIYIAEVLVNGKAYRSKMVIVH